MKPVKRLLTLVIALVAVLALAGCGNKHPGGQTHLGETEGIYVTSGDLTYQVQISRQLNPNDVEDAAYLKGVDSAFLETESDEVLFAVFIRVENETKRTLPTSDEFKIVDTQHNEYEPIPIDPAKNPFVYEPKELASGDRIPDPDSIDFQGPIQGSMILFKVTLQSIADRPLEFEIFSRDAPPAQERAIVDLDV